MYMHRTSQPLHEVIGRPGSGELHVAILQLLAGARVLVLVALDTLVIDKVCDVEQHFAGIHPPATDLFIERTEHAVHLHRHSPRLGLSFALPGGILPQTRQVFFTHPVHRNRSALLTAAVVQKHL
jgi:hypothetical protein